MKVNNNLIVVHITTSFHVQPLQSPLSEFEILWLHDSSCKIAVVDLLSSFCHLLVMLQTEPNRFYSAALRAVLSCWLKSFRVALTPIFSPTLRTTSFLFFLFPIHFLIP